MHRFKPLLDAFQGSYKDRYYYWVAVQITIRSLLFVLYAFQTKIKLILSTFLLITFSVCNGCIYPHKNKLVNIQETALLINLIMMHAVSYQSNERIFLIATNVMISLAFFSINNNSVMYHLLTYTCHCNVAGVLQTLKNKFTRLSNKIYENDFDVELLNIPERTYNYTEYQVVS